MSSPLRILISLRGHGRRGPRYRVHLNGPGGLVLLDGSTEPLLDSARMLLSRGITGKIEMWDSARTFPRMQGDIERLAGMTVSEGDAGITLRKYVERTAGGDFEAEASSDTEIEISRPGCVAQACRAMEAA